MRLLAADDSQPVIVERAGSGASFLFTCDHNGREIPRSLGRLGLAQDELDRHIAWDIGAGGLTRRLSQTLGATAILQRYSRLVIDCNRDPQSPAAAPAVSDATPIPANQGLSAAALAQRVAAIHAPYHAAITAELDARQAQGLPTILVFMHSFTPRMAGFERPWHFGVIREETSRFSKLVLERLGALPGYVTGDNLPYAMDGIDYSAPTHAFARNLDYLELEVRQDLIADEDGRARIAAVLEQVLPEAAAAL